MPIDPAVVAASVAAAVATVALVAQAISDRKTRAQLLRLDGEQRRLQEKLASQTSAQLRALTDRDHWWTRFSWALEGAVGPNQQQSEACLAILIGMAGLSWATKEDNGLIAAITRLIITPNGGAKK